MTSDREFLVSYVKCKGCGKTFYARKFFDTTKSVDYGKIEDLVLFDIQGQFYFREDCMKCGGTEFAEWMDDERGFV